MGYWDELSFNAERRHRARDERTQKGRDRRVEIREQHVARMAEINENAAAARDERRLAEEERRANAPTTVPTDHWSKAARLNYWLAGVQLWMLLLPIILIGVCVVIVVGIFIFG